MDMINVEILSSKDIVEGRKTEGHERDIYREEREREINNRERKTEERRRYRTRGGRVNIWSSPPEKNHTTTNNPAYLAPHPPYLSSAGPPAPPKTLPSPPRAVKTAMCPRTTPPAIHCPTYLPLSARPKNGPKSVSVIHPSYIAWGSEA